VVDSLQLQSIATEIDRIAQTVVLILTAVASIISGMIVSYVKLKTKINNIDKGKKNEIRYD